MLHRDEKPSLGLMVLAQKLHPYFPGHIVVIPTKFPLKQVLQKLENLGQLAKWAIELGEFDIQFKLITTIKGQALAGFIIEFTYRATDHPQLLLTVDLVRGRIVNKI